MAVEHRNIPEDGLHEPKGVSNSAANKVYIADGGGSGNWLLVDADTIQGTINNSSPDGQYVQSDGGGGFKTASDIPWSRISNIPTEFPPESDDVVNILASKAEIDSLTEIADPTTASAEDVANKVNAVIQALKAGV